jgi:methionyl aminopeptidase
VITIKSPADFALMARAGRVVAEVHEKLRAAAKPGVRLIDLDAMAAEIIRRRGATPSFLNYHGFPAHVCLSPNNVIVHGIPDHRRLEEGDLLSLDAGAIVEGWHADAAITFEIGDVPAEAVRLNEATKQGMWAGIEATKAGARLGDIGAAVQQVGEAAGFGVVREYTGHGIGRQMHEEPQVLNYGIAGKGLKMKRGMAICIEPMFNAGGRETRLLEDGWSVVTADGSLSAHWEHTIAITADGPRVLTLPD